MPKYYNYCYCCCSFTEKLSIWFDIVTLHFFLPLVIPPFLNRLKNEKYIREFFEEKNVSVGYACSRHLCSSDIVFCSRLNL